MWMLKPIFPGAAFVEGASPARDPARGASNAVRRESMSFTISSFATGFQGDYRFSNSVQFMITLMGSDAVSVTTELMRNFWPSGIASQRWMWVAAASALRDHLLAAGSAGSLLQSTGVISYGSLVT
jgi:hypothetical protein